MAGQQEMTMNELRHMADRQKRQIEAQQQMLVAKEQRLKFLRQQEQKHQQAASQKEELEKRLTAQEMKLKKLRALRGQVEQYKAANGALGKSGHIKNLYSSFTHSSFAENRAMQCGHKENFLD